MTCLNAKKQRRLSNKHLQATAGLISGGVGLSFGVVGSRFTALETGVLGVADVPAAPAALFPVPGFAFYTYRRQHMH